MAIKFCPFVVEWMSHGATQNILVSLKLNFAWLLLSLLCRTAIQASRISSTVSSTSSVTWALALLESWWVRWPGRGWKQTGALTHWNWSLFYLKQSLCFSTDHWDDLQYGSLLCYSQQQGGHLRWIVDLYPSPLLYRTLSDYMAFRLMSAPCPSS